MNECGGVRSVLLVQADRPEAAERDRVAAHLAGCEACRTFAQELSIVNTGMGPGFDPELTPAGTEAFIVRLRDRLAGEAPQRVPVLTLVKAPGRTWWWGHLATGLAVVVAAVIWIWPGPVSPGRGASPSGPALPRPPSTAIARVVIPPVPVRPAGSTRASPVAVVPSTLAAISRRVARLDARIEELGRSVEGFGRQARADSRARAHELTARRVPQWK